MRLRFIALILLIALLASDGAFSAPQIWRGDWPIPRISREPLTQPDGLPLHSVVLAPTFPNRAVDYIGTYAWKHYADSYDPKPFSVYRHGDLVRETNEVRIFKSAKGEFGERVSYANLATGAGLEGWRDADGRLESFSIWKGRSLGYSIVNSGKSERIAGERCTVWIATPATEGALQSACIAPDGVVLRETSYSGRGDIMEEKRAVSIKRQTVSLSDVLPPVEALDWSYWNDNGKGGGQEPVPSENYHILLVRAYSDNENQRAIDVFRAAGGLKAEEMQSAERDYYLSIKGPTFSFSVSTDSPQVGFSRRSLNLGKPGPARGPEFISVLQPRLPTSRLGQLCRWVQTGHGWHSNREECLTQDGLPLVINIGPGSPDPTWEAVEVYRGQTPDWAMRPPAWALSWSYWGWPQLASKPTLFQGSRRNSER